ncbi:nucleotidyltransferase family protein [Erwinia sp. CGal63]|uniref:nucleotidyltransferase family protein n=1 Tax=Erwinia sp. CGal63 TaxID=2919889 RepID=UPI0030089823
MDWGEHREKTIGVLVIAAGRGQRYKAAGGATDKLQAEFADASGQSATVFVHSCLAAQQSGLPVCVVTRPGQHAIRQYCEQQGIATVLVENTRMGESIAAGVRHTADWDGWLIHLADMPFITADTLRLVAGKVVEDGAVRPTFNGRPGHPVGFGRGAFQALSTLSEEQGARSLLVQFPLYTIEMRDETILRDIDLPSQLPTGGNNEVDK